MNVKESLPIAVESSDAFPAAETCTSERYRDRDCCSGSAFRHEFCRRDTRTTVYETSKGCWRSDEIYETRFLRGIEDQFRFACSYYQGRRAEREIPSSANRIDIT